MRADLYILLKVHSELGRQCFHKHFRIFSLFAYFVGDLNKDLDMGREMLCKVSRVFLKIVSEQ